MYENRNLKQTELEKGRQIDPLGFHFAEEPQVVSTQMMASTSQWVSNPNTKEWDYDEDWRRFLFYSDLKQMIYNHLLFKYNKTMKENEEIKSRLLSMVERDQEMRQRAARGEVEWDESVDRENTKELKEILKKLAGRLFQK